jgi:hypothetical protein
MSGDSGVLELCPDIDVLRITQPHVLMVGPPSMTSVLLDAMRSALPQPVVESGIDVGSMPAEGTVILRNVQSLDARAQRALSEPYRDRARASYVSQATAACS